MATEQRVPQSTSAKRKMYHWVLEFVNDQQNALNESAQARLPAPDVKDIVGILRACGFRLANVEIGHKSAQSGCRVEVRCERSGLRAVLETEAECRCPDTANENAASAWCVVSPSSSQESLNTSEQAGSSLLPEVPLEVAQVVGAATRFLLHLIEESEPSSKSSSAALSHALSRALSSGICKDPTRLGSQLARHRSLDEMEWEMAQKSPQERSLTSSQSEGRLAQAVAARPVAVTVRRQSSTLDATVDYSTFKSRLSDEIQLFKPEISEDCPTLGTPKTSLEGSSVKRVSGDAAAFSLRSNVERSSVKGDTVRLSQSQAQEVIAKAEDAMENMSAIMDTLKKLVVSDEVSTTHASPGAASDGRVKKPAGRAAGRTAMPPPGAAGTAAALSRPSRPLGGSKLEAAARSTASPSRWSLGGGSAAQGVAWRRLPEPSATPRRAGAGRAATPSATGSRIPRAPHPAPRVAIKRQSK